MKIERTKNATKNIFFGMILKIYQMLIPFLMRTAMIYYLGIEYLGLNSLFTSILQVLNLAELGVGGAMIFSMYKPIAEDDDITICALMKLYKTYYRIIGLVVLILGLIICPFIPYLIKSDLPPDINVYILYLLNLFATVLSYWLFAYKNSILQAYQRIDVISKITIIINTIQYLLQFAVIFLFKNYYGYVTILLLSQIVINIYTAIVSDKMYPKYKANGNLDKKNIKAINQRVKDLFIAKIGGVIVNSADTIVISAFLGLTVLAIYQNYFYILNSLVGLIGVIFSSCTAGIGNSLAIESEEKNYNDFCKFSFLITWLIGIISCELLCLYQPFMKIWVSDKYLLGFPAVICFCIYYFVYEENMLLCVYKDAAGIWHSDRFRPLITAGSNLIINLILVNIIGIYGVLLSTVLTTVFIGFPWLLHILFKEIFKRNLKQYIIDLSKNIIVVLVSSVITFKISNLIECNSWILLIIKSGIVFILFNILLYLYFRKTSNFNELKILIKRILIRK